MKTVHIINCGMGVESIAAFLRWVYEPETRPFDWADAIMLIAQVGDEYNETIRLMETHILPIVRQIGLRLVEVCRTGEFESDGYTILQDSTEPYVLHPRPAFTLGINMEQDAFVPRLNKPHICAMKYKGFPLDRFIFDHFKDFHIGPYLFYNADEKSRESKSDGYTCQGHNFIFPLIEANINRAGCEAIIQQYLGIQWHKSCCVHCPFQKPASRLLHWSADPEAGAIALWREHLALIGNPRMGLFGTESTAYKFCQKHISLHPCIELFEQRMDDSSLEWAVWRVRRIYQSQMNASRCMEKNDCGSFPEMQLKFQQLAQANQATIVVEAQMQRFYIHCRTPKVYPSIEEYYCLAPAVPRGKCARMDFEGYEKKWRQQLIQKSCQQIELFA